MTVEDIHDKLPQIHFCFMLWREMLIQNPWNIWCLLVSLPCGTSKEPLGPWLSSGLYILLISLALCM